MIKDYYQKLKMADTIQVIFYIALSIIHFSYVVLYQQFGIFINFYLKNDFFSFFHNLSSSTAAERNILYQY